MASAREILDERLAKGEITAQQHEELAARLDSPRAAAPVHQAQSSPQGGLSGAAKFFTIGGVVGSIVLIIAVNSGVRNIIGDCISRGGSEATCQATAVSWPIVLGAYGLFALIGISSAVSLFVSRKRPA